ncbi:MAG TPA: hypothetical protein VNX01_11815 [Bacteroidia bacterium]|jgi:hypothetical protein|nr:hypothetical protein [Bacteroidia bacterium]
MNTIRNWLVSGAKGRNIFYFKLYTINEKSGGLYFDSNILFRASDTKLIDRIELLVSHELPIQKKDAIAANLFEMVQKIEYYKQFYFDETVLDKDGRLNLSSYELMQKLNTERLKNSNLLPISKYSYPELFVPLRSHFHLNQEEIMASSKVITKSAFEEQLITELLKYSYVYSYKDDNVFYLHTSEAGETYFILNKGELLFAFDTK